MSTRTYPRSSARTGWVVFAGEAFVIGCFNMIQGFVALFKEEVYLVPGPIWS